MSTIPTVDHALVEVHQLEMLAEQCCDESLVCACKLVLTGLLDLRLHLPQQRTDDHGVLR